MPKLAFKRSRLAPPRKYLIILLLSQGDCLTKQQEVLNGNKFTPLAKNARFSVFFRALLNIIPSSCAILLHWTRVNVAVLASSPGAIWLESISLLILNCSKQKGVFLLFKRDSFSLTVNLFLFTNSYKHYLNTSAF